MNPFALIALAFGGGAGALCRGLATRALKKHLPGEWPWPTFLVNMLACFIAGFLLHVSLNDIVRAGLVTGFLGGFSTLATMNFEAVGMFRSKRYLPCLLYLCCTYGGSIAGAILGFLLAGIMLP